MAGADARSHVDLAPLYEQLRRRALDGGWGGAGYVVLRRDGMKSWIETCLRIPRPSVPVCPAHELATTNVPSCGDLVQLIAAMVLQIHQQGATS
jgi:hypothetical protein